MELQSCQRSVFLTDAGLKLCGSKISDSAEFIDEDHRYQKETTMNVRNMLQQKDLHVWSAPPETTVLEAVNMMFEKNVGALVIIDNERVVGMFSERDIARKLIPKEAPSHDTAVSEIMTPSVITVTPEQSVDACMALMTEHRIRHVPVLENRKIVGLISIGDVLKAVIMEKEHFLRQSENATRIAR